jgi:ABC-type transporter Mla subunit MlaD
VVKTDSKAIIKFTGLMGQNFVAIGFGSAGTQAAEGAHFGIGRAAGFERHHGQAGCAAGGIQNITKTFSGDKIDNILGPLTDFVKQNSAPITATISNVKNISSQIAAGQGTHRQTGL